MSYPMPRMQVELVPAARDQLPVIDNLIQLYAHDFSEFQEIQLDANGRFQYTPLPLYWTEPTHHPFLVKADGKLAGFVLVKQEAGVWDMAEFFIVRGCRRHGIGTTVAHQVWRRFPGPWEVRVMEANQGAVAFWERAISKFIGAPVKSKRVAKNGKLWHHFGFDSAPAV